MRIPRADPTIEAKDRAIVLFGILLDQGIFAREVHIVGGRVAIEADDGERKH